MPESNVASIADRPSRDAAARLFRVVLGAAIAIGTIAAWRVAVAGLTLSHYDARAHLVVARRIADSLTPGWRQLGAVWLPLPHLVNLVPVQWDWAYRTGGVGVAISIVALAWVLAALVLTRYEGWLIGAGLAAITGFAGRRRPVRELMRLAAPSAAAVLSFFLLSFASTGRWLASTDFFIADGEALNRPLKAADVIWSGVLSLSNVPLGVAAVCGAIVCLVRARWRAAALLPLSLTFCVVLPLIAFTAGHPFRIRYMVPLVAACGVLAGVALSALPRRAWPWAAGALVTVSLWISPPFSLKSPMPVEAQWETPMRLERQRVTEVLRARYDGTPILASMGSLGHYMQESSSIGLHLRNFVHEGNGDLWTEAVRSPRRSVRWVLVEERAEGGDMLAGLARKDPAFLAGFTRVAEGGGLALYERKTDSGSRFP